MVTLKNAQEIELMRSAGRIIKEALQKLRRYVKAGLTTLEIDEFAATLIKERGGLPAFKGYRGFPANTCISVNEEVVHGVPSKRQLLSGDIVSIDLGVCYQGYFADAAITLPIGRVNGLLKKLIRVTRDALWLAVKQARAGNFLGDISFATQSHAESQGFSVVRDFVGHGIGCNLQEEPQVPNFGKPRQGLLLNEGMVLAIEPMVNMGSWEIEVLADNWTVVTKDRQPSAHFEHTVAITRNGPEVLT